MNRVELTIQPEVFRLFPTLEIHAVRASSLRGISATTATTMLEEALRKLKIDGEHLSEHPIVAGWREAYGAMGVKPSKFRSSIESLLRRAAKSSELALPIPAVNAYNACSLNNLAPLGACDVGRLPEAHVTVRFARPQSDQFDPLGSEASSFPLVSTLAVYAAGNSVLCWGLNSRDAKVAALDDVTDDAIFFSEAVSAVHRDPALNAISSLSQALSECGADCGKPVRLNSSEHQQFV